MMYSKRVIQKCRLTNFGNDVFMIRAPVIRAAIVSVCALLWLHTLMPVQSRGYQSDGEHQICAVCIQLHFKLGLT